MTRLRSLGIVAGGVFLAGGFGSSLYGCSSSSKGGGETADSGASSHDSGAHSDSSSGIGVDTGVASTDSGSATDTSVSTDSETAEDTSAPPTDSGSVETGTTDGPAPVDSGSPVDSGTPADAAEAAAGGDTLVVMNYAEWCSVTINGGLPSANGSVTAQVTPGSMATIIATPASGAYAIGTDPWFGVNQNDGGAASGTDMGTGMNETSTATVTVTANNQCVSVCCGFSPGGTGCPTTNPCPP
jgi:hypothetical protein